MAGETSKYLFWLGVLIALIIAVLPFAGAQTLSWLGWLILIQIILGLVIGYLNISVKEIDKFLLASVAFMLAYPVFQMFTVGSVATAGITALTQAIQGGSATAAMAAMSAMAATPSLQGLWLFIDYFLMGLAALVASAVLVVACKVLPEIMKD